MPTLARDAESRAGHRYLHEGIDVPAAPAPTCTPCSSRTRPPAASHIVLDGSLIATDRCRTTNPNTGP
jgi:hypothetical protein